MSTDKYDTSMKQLECFMTAQFCGTPASYVKLATFDILFLKPGNRVVDAEKFTSCKFYEYNPLHTGIIFNKEINDENGNITNVYIEIPLKSIMEKRVTFTFVSNEGIKQKDLDDHAYEWFNPSGNIGKFRFNNEKDASYITPGIYHYLIKNSRNHVIEDGVIYVHSVENDSISYDKVEHPNHSILVCHNDRCTATEFYQKFTSIGRICNL